MKIVLIILFLSLSACVFAAGPQSPAEQEDVYRKDRAPVGRRELPILVNKLTGKVEYYWSEETKMWVEAGKRQAELQKQYDDRDKIRDERSFKQTQEEMNRLHDESFKEIVGQDY